MTHNRKKCTYLLTLVQYFNVVDRVDVKDVELSFIFTVEVSPIFTIINKEHHACTFIYKLYTIQL